MNRFSIPCSPICISSQINSFFSPINQLIVYGLFHFVYGILCMANQFGKWDMKVRKFKHRGTSGYKFSRKNQNQRTSSYNVSGKFKIKELLVIMFQEESKIKELLIIMFQEESKIKELLVSVLFSFSKPKSLPVPVLSEPLKKQAVFME